MTLCVSWVRKLQNSEELIIATDSRIRSLGSWDCSPKIMLLPRTDCAICFEGDTMFAYPMLIQLRMAVSNFQKSLNRSQDLYDFKGHIIKILNDMLKYKSDYELPETSFLFGGYSWKKDKFVLWHIHYDNHIKAFTHRPISFWRGVNGNIKVSFTGDYTDDAKDRLIKYLRERDKLTNGNLDMEPLEVLRDMLKEQNEEKYPLIGGSPQIIKVYRHMNRIPLIVKWENKGEPINTLLGRPLLKYEKTNFPVIDLETMRVKLTN